jgi:hypothetical protein
MIVHTLTSCHIDYKEVFLKGGMKNIQESLRNCIDVHSQLQSAISTRPRPYNSRGFALNGQPG